MKARGDAGASPLLSTDGIEPGSEDQYGVRVGDFVPSRHLLQLLALVVIERCLEAGDCSLEALMSSCLAATSRQLDCHDEEGNAG